MSTARIDGFAFDAENEEKLAQHGLSTHRVDQVLENDYLLVPNRKDRRAPYLVIGTHNGGARISVVIEKTRVPGIWRPVTGWPSKDSEKHRLEVAKGKRR